MRCCHAKWSRICTLALLVAALIALAALPAVCGGRGDWWMFHRNPQHTGLSPFNGPQTPRVHWRTTVGAWGSSPVISSDGTIYIGSADGYLNAIAPDGVVQWSISVASWIDTAPAIASDGTVYMCCPLVTADNVLSAVSPEGAMQWNLVFNRHGAHSSPAIAPSGIIVMGSLDTGIYTVNADGTKRWQLDTNKAMSAPAIADDGTIYSGSYDGYLYAVRPAGTVKWRYAIDGPVVTAPAVGPAGIVYVGSDNGYLYAVGPDGQLVWKYRTEGLVRSSPAVDAEGSAYFGSTDKYVYAVDSDGHLKWRFLTGDIVVSSPAVDANGVVYVGSSDGNVYALNPDGSERWRVTTGGPVQSSPAIGEDGRIYVGSNDGYLYAIGSSGEPPTISISVPSTDSTVFGPVTYTITYSEADAITLSADDIILNATGTADGIVGVSGTGNTRTVTISSITGTGTLGISIGAGTASNTSGSAAATGPSAPFMVSQPAVWLSITSPTNQPSCSIEASQVTIGGTASSTTKSVSWVCDRGGKGKCTGTTSWTARGVRLCAGENVVTFTASDGKGNTATASVMVVTPSLKLQANPSTVDACDPVTLTWTSTGARSVVSSNFGATDVSGSARVEPVKTTTYTIAVLTAGGKHISASTTVKATPVKPSITIIADPKIISAGESAVLSWSSTRALAVSACSFGASTVSGTVSVSPLRSATYTITVKSRDGNKATGTARVTVKPLKPYITLRANPATIRPGETTFLEWSSTNATAVVKSNFEAEGVDGRMEVAPAKSMTYTIKVRSIDGSTSSASAKVTVKK